MGSSSVRVRVAHSGNSSKPDLSLSNRNIIVFKYATRLALVRACMGLTGEAEMETA